jgi:hypothetical protein
MKGIREEFAASYPLIVKQVQLGGSEALFRIRRERDDLDGETARIGGERARELVTNPDRHAVAVDLQLPGGCPDNLKLTAPASAVRADVCSRLSEKARNPAKGV